MTTREQELIGEHLDYEIKMLHETRKALRGEPVPTGVIANVLMESFCVHARNLNEFFFENPHWPDIGQRLCNQRIQKARKP